MKQDKEVNFTKIEKKWQKKWEESKIFEVKENPKKEKFYVLDMFPYPSGAGLHMGHAFVFSLGDIYARFKRLQGYNVLYPIGYDSLGLPAENAAIAVGTHPEEYTKKSIANFMKQQKAMGWSYDWNRILKTSDPEFYKWDQWIFLKMLEKGLAYRKKAPVNWCRKCETVLANEQVVEGRCWRHEDVEIEIRHLEQWFLKITDYAEELLSGLDTLDWPENAKKRQRNWIGRSEGSEVMFEVNGEKWQVFTTRPDTLFGVTFLVVSAQHPRLMELVTKEQKKDVEAFVKKVHSTSEKDADTLEKEGAFTGSYAIHPLTKEKIPIWTGNFVLADYGSGMVMAVPAHDQRDFEFAKKYGITIKEVIEPVTGIKRENEEFRKSIVAIVENMKTRKVLTINWGGKLGGHLFIGGGIDDNEDTIQCALREIEEETGYHNLKFIAKTGKIHHHYVAHSKNVNREIEATGLYFQLVNEEKKKTKLEATEKGKFSVEWMEKEKVLNNVKDELHRLVFQKLLIGEAYAGYGVLVNSEGFDGLKSEEAKILITEELAKKGLGKKTVNYKLRDWLISRQRYWGTPIPVVYCEKCGIVPVKEKDLPVALPHDVKFGEGNPLATNNKFVNTKCPKCAGNAKRETDTMDTFANSSWYYLRYTDPHNDKKIFDEKKANYWTPVDQYIGGPEHITMHLIYFRFYAKFLRDLGLLKFDEPALRYFTQGIVHASDGEKMSKSKGNVIEPLEYVEKYGADTLRLGLVSFASPDKNSSWDEKIIGGSHKFLFRVYEYFSKWKAGKTNPRIESKLNKTIKEVTEMIENFRHNLAVIKIRELFDYFSEEQVDKKTAQAFLKLLHIYCPFITEELWEKIGEKDFISQASWPHVDESKINEEFEKAEQAVEKTVSDILNILKIMKEKQGAEGEQVYIYVLPNEKQFYNPGELARRVGKEVSVFAVNDKEKHDPQGKSSKAKPGKPAIYVE